MNISPLSKRLLQAMQIGVTVRYANDGHRWIVAFEETDQTCELNAPVFSDMMEKAGIIYDDKIYGGVYEALNYIDFLLNMAGEPSLLDQFDESKSWRGEDCHPFDAFGDTESPTEKDIELFKTFTIKKTVL